MRRFLKRSALALLFILAIVYGLMCYYAPKIVFYGAYFDDTRACPAAESSPDAEAIEFTTADGTVLRGWLWNRGAGLPLVAVYGGNNMNVGSLAGLAAVAPRTNFLMLNHRGYGGSEGEPTEERVIGDARAALQHYRAQLGNPQHVTLLGFSLGTGVATQLAATEAPGALILACPFDSVLATACQHVPVLPRLLPIDHFRSDLAAPKVTCPVTTFMGVNDTIVPPARTMSLMKCFTSTEVMLHIIPSGHNDIFAHREVQDVLVPLLNAG